MRYHLFLNSSILHLFCFDAFLTLAVLPPGSLTRYGNLVAKVLRCQAQGCGFISQSRQPHFNVGDMQEHLRT